MYQSVFSTQWLDQLFYLLYSNKVFQNQPSWSSIMLQYKAPVMDMKFLIEDVLHTPSKLVKD